MNTKTLTIDIDKPWSSIRERLRYLEELWRRVLAAARCRLKDYICRPATTGTHCWVTVECEGEITCDREMLIAGALGDDVLRNVYRMLRACTDSFLHEKQIKPPRYLQYIARLLGGGGDG